MAVQLIHKNSSVEDRRPTAAQLANGELSLNYNEAGPFLCCKDSDGNIQQLGGIKFNPDVPADAVTGTWWWNTATETLYVYDGTVWKEIKGGGGGGGSGITQILGDDGIDATVIGSVVTLNVDIDPNKGLYFELDRLAINPGANISFDADGKLQADIDTLSYKGTIDLTSDPVPASGNAGDAFANIGTGAMSAAWQIATGLGATTVSPGDLVVKSPTAWSYIPTGGVEVQTDLGIDNRGIETLDVTSSTGTDVTIPAATDALAGLMTAADKTDLDGLVAGGAAPYVRVAGDNMTGDLTLGTDKITLKAADGSATFASGDVNIDSSGRLLVGTSSARANFIIGVTGYAPQTQLEGGVLQTSFVRATSPFIGLAASNAAAANVNTGNISFFGFDGTNFIRTAEVSSKVDGTPGTNDMPGRLVFSTTADGAALPTERMLIDSSGDVKIGGTTLPSAPNITLNANGSADFAAGGCIISDEGEVTVRKDGNLFVGRSAAGAYTFVVDSSSYLKLGPSQGIILNGALGNAEYKGDIKIGGTLPAAPNISLTANGNITAAGFGTFGGGGSSTNSGVTILAGGTIKASKDIGADAGLEIYQVGTTDPNVTVRADGRITAAGDVKIGGSFLAPNISLNADGSADFAGDIKIGGTLPSSPNIKLEATGAITAELDATINGLTLGKGTGALSNNTALGMQALNSATTGNYNTAIGNQALLNNTTGNYNAAFGDGALTANLGGGGNVGIGFTALNANISGSYNIAVGYGSLAKSTTGGNNCAIGYNTLADNTLGAGNVANGHSALAKNTTGSYNIGLGHEAGFYLEGSNNTILGAYKGVTGDSTLSDTVIIAAGLTERARCHASGVWNLGTSAPVYADNATAKVGGLVDGDVYRTATGQLMIVFT